MTHALIGAAVMFGLVGGFAGVPAFIVWRFDSTAHFGHHNRAARRADRNARG